jgi:hypothetical protein
MKQIKATEQTRLPPQFTHPAADATGAKMFKSRLFKIGMTGDISSKILYTGDDRMIAPWQTGDDLRKVPVDASRLPNLKNTAIVENLRAIAMHILKGCLA